MDDQQSTQLELLQNLLSDNKALTKEAKLQLSLVENLEREKKAKTNELRNIQREAQLCKERDDLNARRNTALARENRLLRQRCDEISTEKMRMQKTLEEKIVSMEASYEEQLEDAGWANDRLGIDIVVKETKLKKIQKDCKHLVERNRQIRKLIKPTSS